MTDDELRAANENSKRAARIKSASDPDARRLSEVEQAVIAAHEELAEDAAEFSRLVATERMTQTVAMERMAERKEQSQAYLDKLKTSIVDPIATKIEARAKATAFQMPARNENHNDALRQYERASLDKKQDLITNAIAGLDNDMAEALLIAQVRLDLHPETREHLMRRLSPMTDDKDQIMDMAKRVQSTLNTIKGARS